MWIAKTQRQDVLLSDGEVEAFYQFQDQPTVKDIREQFPLDKDETIEIARWLGIRQPWHDDRPITMTTDFLLTHVGTSPTYAVRQYKQRKALEDTRTLEKLEIDSVYWSARGFDWGIITEFEAKAPRAD
jgi:hypothetical protein